MRASDFITEGPSAQELRTHFADQAKRDMQRDSGGFSYMDKQTADAINKNASKPAKPSKNQVKFSTNAQDTEIKMTEQPVTTTNQQGVTTTVNKAANRVTTRDAGGTVVKDRTGNMRSITTPKIGGVQLKQTFRPDATPGYGQATGTAGGTTLDMKGSPETGYTKTVGTSVGGLNMQAKDRYSGQKEFGVSATMGNDQKISATQTISKPGAKPVTKMSMTKGGKPIKALQTNDINEAFEQAMFEDEVTLEDTQDFHEEYGYLGYSIDENDLFEAEYQGRKVKLNKPTRGDVKKFKVYVKNKKGNVIKVNFGHGGTSAKKAGQKTMSIKKSDPARRRSFRARHNCDNPGPKTKARYWSCRKW